MSYFLTALLVLCICILITICCMQLYFHHHKNAKLVNQFPGPKVLPVIGNMLDIVTDQATIFCKLRKFAKMYYPSYRLWSSTTFYAINILAPEDMQLVLSNVKHNDKSDIYMLLEEWLGEGLLTSKGEKWQHRRKILTPTFHFSILKQYIGIFNKHAEVFTNEIAKSTDESIKILPHIHKCSLHTIAEAAMGTTLDDKKNEEVYRNAIHSMGDILVYRVMRPWFYFRLTNLFSPNFWKERFLLRYLKNFTKRVIDEREAIFDEQDTFDYLETDDIGIKKKRLAMLDLLISAKRRKEIDYDGVREEVDTFMFEGHDTIAMAMEFCYMLLACHKTVQDKAYEELKLIFGNSNREPTFDDLQAMHYLEMVIKESLRMYPSVPLISRVTGEEIITHSGQMIPKGAILILHIYDTHHNPNIYPEPEKYIPERFLPENIKTRHPYAYLPFSAGSRNCIGQKYAMLNMKSMVATTLRKFELCPVDTPDTITLIADIILRTKSPIKMIFKDRN